MGPATEADLPEQVQGLIAYRKAASAEAQALILGNLSVRWDLLADAAQGPLVWKAIARQMGPQALRMNLNTLLRHDVFSNGTKENALVDYVAGRIADAAEIRRSRQFPYQFLAAYLNADESVPQKIKAALHQAAETACGNVPELPGPVLIGLDTSGSMGSPVTGHRGRGRPARCGAWTWRRCSPRPSCAGTRTALWSRSTPQRTRRRSTRRTRF